MRAFFFCCLMMVGCAQSTPPSKDSEKLRARRAAVALIEERCDNPTFPDTLCEAICVHNGYGTWFGPDATNERGHCEAADGYRVRSRCRVVPSEGHLRNVQIIDGNFVGEVVTENVGPPEVFVAPNGAVAVFP